MDQLSISKGELIPRFKASLQDYGFMEHTICRHLYGIRDLLSFMEGTGIDAYTKEIGIAFVKNINLNDTYSLYYKKARISSIHLINVILEGRPYETCRKQIHGHKMHGEFGKSATSFVEKLRVEERLSASTLKVYNHDLSLFSKRMQLANVTHESLAWNDILMFMSSVQNSRVQVITRIKRFMSFLYGNGFINNDYSLLFKGIKPLRKEKLPSVYTPEEVMRIEKSVNRSSGVGKRDYAIILLASRLGLRSSDIRKLRFSNLDWDNSIISLKQYKTKRNITLPLLADVGDALIDYIIHGRPTTAADFVFVTAVRPYREMQPPSLSNIIQRYIYKSGIDHKGKHTGCHTLRHSLATMLLQEGTALPVISETLGHRSSSSTMYYLGVDICRLLECSLDVPFVDNHFYTQKGGILYE